MTALKWTQMTVCMICAAVVPFDRTKDHGDWHHSRGYDLSDLVRRVARLERIAAPEADE